jgi:hypothetical protein
MMMRVVEQRGARQERLPFIVARDNDQVADLR